MDYKYIEQLVDSYFEGTTSLEEEQILRSFFKQEQLPASLQPYAPLFRYEQEQREITLDGDFDARMLALVDTPVVKSRRSWHISLRPIFRAAAMVAIVLTVGNAAQHSFDQESADEYGYDSYTDTYTDPSTAYQQVSDALQMLSESIQKAQTMQADSMVTTTENVRPE